MGSDNFVIVGGGPAGAFLAYLLEQSGFSPRLYESLPKFAVKPCGMGVPRQIEKIFKVPDDLIMNEIKRYRAYLDGELLIESNVEHWGWMIDKEKLISYFLEGSEVIKKRINDDPEILKKMFPDSIIIISTGSYWNRAGKERINALELTLKLNEKNFDEDTIEIHFDTGMLGYYWIFPWGDSIVNIGVGGLESFPNLREKLSKFVKERNYSKKISSHEIEEKIRGAQIIASGLDLERVNPLDNVFVIGEAAGATFPLTGEGIRPSMITSKLLFDSIKNNYSYAKHLESSDFYYANALQTKIFKIMRSAPRHLRRMIMHSVPKDWLVKFGLGDFTKEEIRNLKGIRGVFIELLSSLR